MWNDQILYAIISYLHNINFKTNNVHNKKQRFENKEYMSPPRGVLRKTLNDNQIFNSKC